MQRKKRTIAENRITELLDSKFYVATLEQIETLWGCSRNTAKKSLEKIGVQKIKSKSRYGYTLKYIVYKWRTDYLNLKREETKKYDSETS